MADAAKAAEAKNQEAAKNQSEAKNQAAAQNLANDQAKFQQETPLDIRNLSFRFSDTDVLNNVSFRIHKGDFAGLVGSNGAGKSTLLRLILGELTPGDGQILLYGEEAKDFDGWQRIGYIAQKNADLNQAFPATVLEVVTANLYKNIGLGRPIRKVHKEKARAALAKTGVADLANKRIGELSGGQQQRVFLARALVNEPELLILDEATSGVDERSEGLFYDMLDELKREQNLTILMVSHDMSAVTTHANRMLCLGADGFFEHDVHQALDQQFFSRLYGYDVVPHVHEHECVVAHGGVHIHSEGGEIHTQPHTHGAPQTQTQTHTQAQTHKEGQHV